MAVNSVAGLLKSADELFSTQEERDNAKRSYVIDLPAAEISDFPDHPFKVRMDESMVELADSVRRHGVLVPSLVRPMPNGGYQMVSGHRRKWACELAEIPTVPCIVRELTDDEAIIVMVDSNLQREQVLPSEKAFAYKMKLEAMKRQGQRTDLTLSPVATKLDSAAALGKQSGESRDQVFRYIRLTNLIPEILDMVDNSVLKEPGKLTMALRPAVELSYLSEQEQKTLLETMTVEDCTPSHTQAIKIRKFSEEGKLNAEVILSIMQEEKPNQVEQFKLPRSRIDKFFPAGTPAQKIEDTIVKALELYRRRQREMER
ncbi:MAG: ParB/RepB/Spo0J family partition protein [Oscillospiraceae bacterium]|nr:ParB/RepB/Spo0J family partition protein [Oscillospiraceae bacterium]